MAEHLKSGRPFILRVLLILLMLGLAWRVLSLGLADAETRASPEHALQWRAQHSMALFLLSEQQVKSPASHDQARKNAVAALRAYPLEGRAYRVLAQIAQSEGNTEQALMLFKKAVYYSSRDLESQLWMLNHSLRTENVVAAVQHLDSLLRLRPELLPQLMPTIDSLLVQPTSQSALINTFVKSPAWRLPLINALVTQEGAAQRYAVFFHRLERTQAGMSEAEHSAWLRALNLSQQWSLAYLNWANQLSPTYQLELGNLFNGGFEHDPLGSEFDWQFDYVSGATMDLASRDGAIGKSALRIRFDQRLMAFGSVRQTLVLPEGQYRLTGLGFADDFRAEHGLVWSVQCLGSGLGLKESQPWEGPSPGWQAFSMDFEVPAERCPAQWLLLKQPAQFAVEQLIGGSLWFDRLTIQKIQAHNESKPN